MSKARNHPENQIAQIHLTYKPRINPSQRPLVQGAEEAYRILLEYWDPERIDFVEQFKVMLINRAGRLLGIYEVSTGSVAGTIADPKLIFAAAIKASAPAIILAHNHPSGDLTPSEEDVKLTRKLKEGGVLLDVEVVDHLVISREGFCSMAGVGMM